MKYRNIQGRRAGRKQDSLATNRRSFASTSKLYITPAERKLMTRLYEENKRQNKASGKKTNYKWLMRLVMIVKRLMG